jgi:hypothetical protein
MLPTAHSAAAATSVPRLSSSKEGRSGHRSSHAPVVLRTRVRHLRNHLRSVQRRTIVRIIPRG